MHYRFAPLMALGLTLLLYLVISPFSRNSGPGLGYVVSILEERGPVSYFIVWLGFYVACMAIIARRRKDYRDSLVVGLFLYSLFPILLGFVAMVLGIFTSIAGYYTFLHGATSNDKLGVIGDLTRGLGTACDPFLLGLLSAIVTMPLIFKLCLIDRGGNPMKGSAEQEAGVHSGAAGRSEG